MDQLATAPRPLKYLPAVYQVGATAFDQGETAATPTDTDPLRAFLAAWEAMIGRISQSVDALEWYFDPATTPPAPPKEVDAAAAAPHEPDFLPWLAEWVDVDLQEVDAPEDARALEIRRRRVVRRAAELYGRRGTVQGLKDLLDAFHGVQVEVQEWAWPQGMRIEVTSVIGVGSALMPDVDLQRAFVVVWRPPQDLQRGLKTWSLRVDRRDGKRAWVGCTVIRADLLKKGDAVVEDAASKIGGWPELPRARWENDPRWESSQPLRNRVQRIRAAIDRERPAHATCYFALDWVDGSEAAPRPLKIGTTSTIGECIVIGDAIRRPT